MALSQFLPLMAFLPSIDGEGVFKVFAIAGIGGLALAVFYRLFRELIRTLVFPKLKREDAYKIIMRFMMLVFLIAVLGIAAWVFKRDPARAEPSPPPAPSVTPVSQVTVYGWVVHGGSDAESPLAGVNVGIHTGPYTKTSSNGDFELDGIPSRLQAPATAELAVTGWYILQPAMVSRGQFIVSGSTQNIKVIVVKRNDLLSAKAVETPVGQRVYCFDYRGKPNAGCPRPASSKSEWHSFLEQKAQEISVPVEKLEGAIDDAMTHWMSKDSSPYQKGLAALYRNDYSAAADFFKSAKASEDSFKSFQATLSASYSYYRARNFAEAQRLLNELTAKQPSNDLLKSAQTSIESHDAPEAAPIIPSSAFRESTSTTAIEVPPQPESSISTTATVVPPINHVSAECDNTDKRAEKLCLITKNILVNHDRRLLDATLTNAVSRDAANAAFNLLVSAKNCSSNVEIHKVKWADYPGSYIALGDCKEFRPRLWALFSQSDDLTIERLGSGDFISSSPSSDVQATARKYAITLMNGDISGFRDHFTDALKTRDSVETVATRLRSMVEATGRNLGNLTSQKDPYTDTVLVTFNNVHKELVLELDLDPSLNIRDWYLRRADESRHIPQKFQDVQ